MPEPQITMLYVHSGSMGYGRMGVNIAAEVAKAGVRIFDGIHGPDDGKLPNEVLEREGERDYGKTETICWLSVPTHARGWYEGQHAVIFTMWEATRLPESFRENLDDFDTVIVPSEQNVELFSQFHNDVRYVPLGIDPVAWHYQPRKPPTTRFNYLIGGSGARKGTDLAVRAFRRVWGQDNSWPAGGPVPHLILKQPKPEDFYGARIDRVPGRISAEDEIALYADAHVYLQPSRGEGFGLQPLQAMAQGCPTILTDAHGQAAFAKHGMALSSRMVKSGYFVYGDAGDWWEPDFDELCERMFWAYHNYDEAQKQANVGSWHVHERFTWARSAQTFLDAVGRDRLGPYTGSGAWVRPRTRMYWTVTNRDWKCDIAGRTYLFRQGEGLYAPADVKRVLFDAGILDPACLGGAFNVTIDGAPASDDVGLLPEQLAKIPEYVAESQFCPTCQQRLNSGVTKADVVLAEMQAQMAEA